MNIRKLRSQKDPEDVEELDIKEVEKPKRTRIKKKEEREKNPVSGALALVVLFGIGLLFVFTTFTNSKPQVKGVQVETPKEEISKQASTAASTIRGRIDDRLDSIKDRVSKLNPEDAVSNAPQIEKLIEDLEALQGMPQESVENVCHTVCDAIDQR